jgi:hypothetical protein
MLRKEFPAVLRRLILLKDWTGFGMPAWGHKCRKRLVNPVPSVLLHPVFS